VCLAIPGQIVEIVDEPNRLARVDVGGVRRNVNVGLLDAEGEPARPGEWVLIHVGFAISRVDEGRRWRRGRCSSSSGPSTSRSSMS
jgi:hydrogenase expression/formation protein HypC